jgi:hypothetical protein
VSGLYFNKNALRWLQNTKGLGNVFIRIRYGMVRYLGCDFLLLFLLFIKPLVIPIARVIPSAFARLEVEVIDVLGVLGLAGLPMLWERRLQLHDDRGE